MTAAEGATKRLALFVVCTCVLVLSINFSILNVALASILEDLHATTAQLQWIISAYTIVFAATLLSTGTVGDRFGRVRTLRAGLILFGVASTLGAFSPSPPFLIAARAVMGVAGATITPMTLSIVASLSSDARERARGIGVWSGMSAVGLAIGPIAGGLLLQHFWWGSVFLVNTPIVVVLVVATRIVPESRDPSPSPFDPLGVVLSILSMSALLWATIEAPDHGWTSASTLSIYAVSLLLVVAFVVWELRSEHPMLELSHLRNPRVSAPTTTAAVTMLAFSGSLLVVSIMLRTVMHYGPLATGIRLVPVALLMVVLGTLSPRIAEHIGTRWTVSLGLLASGAGAAVLAAVESRSGYGLVLLATLLLGAGFSFAAAPAADSVVGALPAAKSGVASGLNATTRQFAQALGVAVIGSLLSSGYRASLRAEMPSGLSSAARSTAQQSISGALDVARTLGPRRERALTDAAHVAFTRGVHTGALATLLACIAGFVVAVRFVPDHARAAVSLGDDADARPSPAHILPVHGPLAHERGS